MADPSLFQDFIPEALEALEEMEAGLLALEAQPGSKQVINTIFRSAHTIKGSAEYLGLDRLSTLAHKLESLLEMFRHGDRTPDGETVDILMAGKDRMVRLVGDLSESREEKTPVDDLLGRLDALADAPAAPRPRPGAAGPKKPAGKTQPGKAAPPPEEELTASPMDDLGELDSLLDDDVTAPAAEPPAALARSEADLVRAADAQSVKDAMAEMDAFATLEEEYDKELFSIFEEHLSEQLGLLSESLSILAAGPKNADECLRALDILEALKSSAGYMDYQKLSALYDEWRAAVEGFRLAFPRQDPLGVKVVRVQAETLLARAGEVRAEAPGEEPGEASEGEDLALLVGAAVAEPPVEPLFPPGPEPLTAGESFLFEEAAPVPPAADQAHQGLFDELDGVFDHSRTSPPSELAVSDPFAEDLEESLSRGAAVPPRTPAPKKSTPAALGDRSQPGPEAGPPMSPPPASRVGKAPKAPKAPAVPKAPAPEPLEEPAAAAPVPPEPTAAKALEAAPAPPAVEAAPAPQARPEAPKDAQAASAPEGAPERDAVSDFAHDELVAERLAKQSLRVDAGKVDKLMNQVGELVVSRASYAQLYYDMRQFQQRLHELRMDSKELKWVRELTFRLSEATVALGRVANDLQEGVMKVRMLPISQLFNRYPRLVRDLAHDTGKKVHLEVRGEETELDKMVIEEIANPLVHIIRNAVDHGIETVPERLAAGKPETAVVKLASYHESNHVVVEISDDGRGIDLDRIRETALTKGFATREELDRMSARELTSLIMKPGFSTAVSVTRTSGRGVGMDVVKKNIEKLNGTVEIESRPGQGTRVRIKIPLTLAIIQALLVRVGKEIFTLPLSVVEETLSAAVPEIATIEGMEVIQLRDRVLPLLRLTDIFHIKSSNTENRKIFVVVVNTGMRDVGLVVDSLIGQEEVVIKPLVDYLQENCGFSGATILGDGRISLILDVYQMVNLSLARMSAVRSFLGPGWQAGADAAAGAIEADAAESDAAIH